MVYPVKVNFSEHKTVIQNDFTSALYLGMYHASKQLLPWQQLTSGVPSVLNESQGTQKVCHTLAKLQGMETGLLYPSTLHLFTDVFQQLGKHHVFLIDEYAYPIMRWALKQASIARNNTIFFKHQNAYDLHKKIRLVTKQKLTPVILTDGCSPESGKVAPLNKYHQFIQNTNGLMIIDDTQGLGILGRGANNRFPVGKDGGGSIATFDIDSMQIIIGSSLAKAFGVPIAALSGSKQFIKHIEKRSAIRMHCSPVSNVDLHACWNALQLNRREGLKKRMDLVRNIRFFQKSMIGLGLQTNGGFLPTQSLVFNTEKAALHVYKTLKSKNIHALITKGNDDKTGLRFLFRADHQKREIIRLIQVFRGLL